MNNHETEGNAKRLARRCSHTTSKLIFLCGKQGEAEERLRGSTDTIQAEQISQSRGFLFSRILQPPREPKKPTVAVPQVTSKKPSMNRNVQCHEPNCKHQSSLSKNKNKKKQPGVENKCACGHFLDPVLSFSVWKVPSALLKRQGQRPHKNNCQKVPLNITVLTNQFSFGIYICQT